VLCVARNSSGGLAWTLFSGGSWSAFANLGAPTVSAPNCANDDNNGVICSVYTISNVTLVNRFTAGAWLGFLNLAGTAGGEPNCAPLNTGGKVACFAKAYNSGIFGTLYNGGAWVVGQWDPYSGLGGTVDENASCTSHLTGQLICGAMSTDSSFYANTYNGASWSGWSRIGGSGYRSPACAPLGGGKVVCMVLGVSNKLTSVVGP